ncbi:calcineurin B-like protein 5 isoform X3 [Lolium perenne]|uniref:calcineurin B-like protein 5 isoform X3 n=1 Tax=Lolium perenne TaxID=4522 RepID=UPI0021F60FFC|nr:calcineurin B-like protein 5 isoform X3 [Lolium perenne]
MGCLPTKHVRDSPRSLGVHEAVAVSAESSCEKVDLPDFLNIATGTPFTVSEVEALYDLFRKISNSVIKDGLIHKEEFHVALFRSKSKKKQNLFGDRLKEMVLALLDESNLDITSDAVEMIVDTTFDQADVNRDGRIDQEEWNVFTKDNPYVLRNMSLPYLKDITMIFPSFVIHSEVSEADMFV